MTMNDNDRQQFRRALGAFVTGVTIVTTRDVAGQPVGLTANSFNSVSLEPPLVLWSLALTSFNLDAFRDTGWWAVHILSASQEALSKRFASRRDDKFNGLDFEEGPGGVPLLDDCAARFVCRTAFEYEGGDHAIFVGEVTNLTLGKAPPLIFHGGQYGRVMPSAAKPPPIEPGDEGAFGRHFTGHLLGRVHHEVFRDVRQEYRKRGLRSAEYTVLAALGLGDGCSREVLISRAARGGVELPQDPIDRLAERKYIVAENQMLHLTSEGHRVLMELIAVAQASQLRLESKFSPEEMGMLLHLLARAGSV